MDTALLLARILLALVFLAAGLSKVADLRGSRQAMLDFGVPRSLAVPFGLLLPLAEIAVAALLVPTATAWAAAIAGLVLLAAFIAGISSNLARGKRPNCHCFGQLHSEPVGPGTLIRNVVLAITALFVIDEGMTSAGAGAFDWAGSVSPVEAVALGVAAAALLLTGIQWWFLANVLKMNGRLLRRIEALEAGYADPGAGAGGLPVGSRALEFSLPDLQGQTRTLQELRSAGKPVVLIFTSHGCDACAELRPEVARWQKERQDVVLALIAEEAQEKEPEPAMRGIANVLLQRADEVGEAYRTIGTPAAVVVSVDGRVASPTVLGSDEIRELMARPVLGAPGHAGQRLSLLDELPGQASQPYPRIGEPAPSTVLQDIDGHTLRLDDFRGSEVLVVFWDTECGFCQAMLPKLQAWERRRPETAPRIFVVSGGSPEEVRAMRLQSPVGLDPDLNVAEAFGADGTPMAVLVDPDGRIASELASGADEVLRLAGAGDVSTATSVGR